MREQGCAPYAGPALRDLVRVRARVRARARVRVDLAALGPREAVEDHALLLRVRVRVRVRGRVRARVRVRVRVLPLRAHVMVPQMPPAHRVVAASPVPASRGSSRSHASYTVRDRVRL